MYGPLTHSNRVPFSSFFIVGVRMCLTRAVPERLEFFARMTAMKEQATSCHTLCGLYNFIILFSLVLVVDFH